MKPIDIQITSSFKAIFYGSFTRIFTTNDRLVVEIPQECGTHAEILDFARADGFLDNLDAQQINAFNAYRSSL